MTPALPPPPSPRSEHADRNVRLDPQGIYGTRSARRQSQLRRRRQFQNGLLWLALALGLVVFGRWALQPRHTALATNQITALPFRPASPPLILPGGDLLFTSQSGGLWRAKPLENGLVEAPRRLWREGFAPAGAPLVTPNQIFWPGGDGVLAALDARTGKEAWRASLPSALVARPALVSSDGQEWAIAGDDAGNVAAFEARTGRMRWKTNVGGALGEGIAILPAQGKRGAGIVVPLGAGAGSRGGLACLDAKSGARVWRFPDDARSQSAGTALPAISRNRVFWCNDEGAVVCLEGGTGRKIWKSFAVPQNSDREKGQGDEQLVMLRGAPTLVEAVGIIVVGGNDGTLRAFEIASGAPRWSQNLGGAVHFAAQSLEFEGKPALLAAGQSPALWLLDAQGGTVLRRWTTRYAPDYGVAFSASNAYALDAGGHLQGAALQ